MVEKFGQRDLVNTTMKLADLFPNRLDELFKQPVPYRRGDDTSLSYRPAGGGDAARLDGISWSARFRVGGRNYIAYVQEDSLWLSEFNFAVQDEDGVWVHDPAQASSGNAFAVYATVMSILWDYIINEKPDLVTVCGYSKQQTAIYRKMAARERFPHPYSVEIGDNGVLIYDPGQIDIDDIRDMFEGATGAARALLESNILDDPNFRSWFGNSKVVDSSGNPLRVYHGTASDFDAFDLTRSGEYGEDFGPAAFFASRPDVASGYAIRLGNNPDHETLFNREQELYRKWCMAAWEFGPDSPQARHLAGERDWATAQKDAMQDAIRRFETPTGGARVLPVYLSIQNPLIVDGGGRHFRKTHRVAIQKARSNGNDGVIIRNVIDSATTNTGKTPTDVFVVFHPQQIKSVWNGGRFSSTSANIGESVLSEVHWTDSYPKSFQDFRKRYMALSKSGGIGDLYVQFTNNTDNTMDRTAWQQPDHHDPVGVYGYPMSYVLSHPADIWYGRGARYLRVLKDTSNRKLNISAIRDASDAVSMLLRMGFDHQDIAAMLRGVKRMLRNRLTGTNKAAKLFLAAVQMDVLAGPEEHDENSPRYRTRTGAEQTALFRKAGFDAIEDTARTNAQAIINDREPEQIIFLHRGAFRVVEVVPLRPGVPDKKLPSLTVTQPDTPAVQRPFAAALAAMMGDKLKEGPERYNLSGWAYYWTKAGRRIEIGGEDYGNSVKRHRSSKLNDNYETMVKIHTEKGVLQGAYDARTKFKDIVAALATDWRALQTTPQETGWTPQDRAGFLAARDAERRDAARRRIEKENARVLKESAEAFASLEWLARHYGVPYTAPGDKTRLILIKMFEQFSARQMREDDPRDAYVGNLTLDDWTREHYPDGVAAWQDVARILKTAWETDFQKADVNSATRRGAWYALPSMQRYLEQQQELSS